jgi:hypothetical protein
MYFDRIGGTLQWQVCVVLHSSAQTDIIEAAMLSWSGQDLAVAGVWCFISSAQGSHCSSDKLCLVRTRQSLGCVGQDKGSQCRATHFAFLVKADVVLDGRVELGLVGHDCNAHTTPRLPLGPEDPHLLSHV